MTHLLRLLSRLAPSWRRAEWLAEWSAEIAAAGAKRPLSLAYGACVHILWLWRIDWSTHMIGSDVHAALRTLAARPLFTATVVLTLALGTGAATAMFTIVDAVVLRPLPYPNADRLVAIWPRATFPPELLGDATAARDSLDAVGAWSAWGFTLTGGAGAEAVDGARITPGLLRVLGVPPIAGQWLSDDTSHPGLDRVALIGERLWQRRFGGDRAAIGTRIAIEGVDFTIVGVMPATFEFPTRQSEIWTPITIDPASNDYHASFAQLTGRLAAGITLRGADDRLHGWATQLHREHPKQFSDRFLERAVVTPLQAQLVRDVRKPLELLFVAVGVLLVIACANTAYLLVVRACGRETEMAVRAALGAGRLRIVRQLLVEAALLSALGGAVGLALAWWLVQVFVPLAPDLPHISRAVVIDPRVAGFAVLIITLCTILFGLAPAWQSPRRIAPALVIGGRSLGPSGRRAWLGRLLVCLEVALATTLVTSAALLGRSFVRLTEVDLGFAPEGVLTLHLAAPDFRYREDAQLRELASDVLQRIRNTPGVLSAGAIHLLPLTPDNWNPGIVIDGWAEADQFQQDVNWRVVTPDYFRVMRIPLRKGRDFSPADNERAMPVALVNEAFARSVLRGKPALGQRVRTFFEGKNNWATIIGVVGDVHQHAIDQPALPEMYRPFAQHPVDSFRVMVRTAGDPVSLGPSLRATIADLDRDVAVDAVQPMASVVDQALGGTRLPLMLAALFSLFATVLGITGVTGILLFDMAERRSEIGLRLALGAPPMRIRRQFLAHGLTLGAAGSAGGIIGAVATAGLLRSFLYGVEPADPTTLAWVSGTLLVAVALAAWLPASRAAHIDPLVTLRPR